jgi:hypothetical protein
MDARRTMTRSLRAANCARVDQAAERNDQMWIARFLATFVSHLTQRTIRFSVLLTFQIDLRGNWPGSREAICHSNVLPRTTTFSRQSHLTGTTENGFVFESIKMKSKTITKYKSANSITSCFFLLLYTRKVIQKLKSNQYISVLGYHILPQKTWQISSS